MRNQFGKRTSGDEYVVQIVERSENTLIAEAEAVGFKFVKRVRIFDKP